jgi:DNA-binding transcriptional regulator YiaG
MKITTTHPASRYGVPVILNDSDMVMNYWTGIKALRSKLGWSTQELADACGVSRRTVEGWESGRMPTVAALNVMAGLISRRPIR